MPYGAGLSDHPLATHAAADADASQQVMDHFGPRPDLALLLTTRPHVEAVGSAMFSPGGIGPVGNRSLVHRYTTSVASFDDN